MPNTCRPLGIPILDLLLFYFFFLRYIKNSLRTSFRAIWSVFIREVRPIRLENIVIALICYICHFLNVTQDPTYDSASLLERKMAC